MDLQIKRNKLSVIEFPGYFESVDKILPLLGGVREIKAGLNTGTVKYKPNSCSTPIPGSVVNTQNLVLKIKKLTNKKGQVKYEYEIVGAVEKTVRFRALADFQVKKQDPMYDLLRDMKDLNVDKLFQFELSNGTKVLPPPSFTKLEWHHSYKYVENTIIKEKDHVGRMPKFERSNVVVVDLMNDPIPKECQLDLNELRDSDAQGYEIYQQLVEVFENRPIWTRQALVLLPQFHKVKETRLSKILPYVAYHVQTGCFRSCWIKYGLDPKRDKSVRVYQILDLRIFKKVKDDEKIAGFQQLVDIKEPEYDRLINSLIYIRPTFAEKDGWYIDGHLQVIREMLKKSIRKEEQVPEETVHEELDLDDQVLSTMTQFMKNLHSQEDVLEDYFDILEED
ncbi:General transcription factor 3C polypeptide 5 [Boothiomyces macroporosus]|uniref:General transcription factor 3C polypeptide 5 n=1 Tax=Boothiomyces macroporosus TaxID=261099 RepID=A0AAD5Y3X4_9FUNG|nr:General transcription factor 3C polypeptide 5 [Boothiomyces macroporosus]